jgi:hypothetical protein
VKTPALDSLAAEGMRFERAYCANPVCIPSRFSMLSGVMPSRISMESNTGSRHVPPEILTNCMGNVFREAGYRTLYGGKVHTPMSLESIGFELLTQDDRTKLAEAAAQFLRQPQDKPFLLVTSFINPHDICFLAIDTVKQRDRATVNYGNGALREALKLPSGPPCSNGGRNG